MLWAYDHNTFVDPFRKKSVFWSLFWISYVVWSYFSKSNLPLDGDILKRLATVTCYLPLNERQIPLICGRTITGLSINFRYTGS